MPMRQRWTESLAASTLQAANVILRSEAKIEFALGTVSSKIVSLPPSLCDTQRLDAKGFEQLTFRIPVSARGVRVYFVDELTEPGTGGKSVEAYRVAAVRFLTGDVNNPVVLGHELCHLLSLQHIDDRKSMEGHGHERAIVKWHDNLMFSSALVGAHLTRKQMKRARSSPLARQFVSQ